MRTLPKTPIDPSRSVPERRHRAIDKRFERRQRIAELSVAIDKMSQRLAKSEFDNGLWAGFGDQEKTNRHWRAARRQRKAFWRLLSALEAEATR